ncbi:DEAD/DEAH box helicase [Oceaniglobus ichthyenteri]|uniref:DEAD/DEAH box helicase n=1 Tax=Oceaniglobus ichthyenteri TaxID=2136177 RepID=UPI000D3B8EE1|nr:DEAD/DEAH box helicase [Oceaniglobus ichthyenteri]
MIQTLADALAQRGYDTLTQVQQAVTDPALDAADLLVSAQTGSGKTVGFGLAIAPTLLDESGRFGPAGTPLALCIAPTRELALQVKRELQWLYGNTGAVVASCVGGMDMRDERRALDRGAHIVVATPGRLRDHIMRNSLKMDTIRAVVLDEADEMLDLGFREDLEYILGEAPAERRTLMFSATVPRAIAQLAQNYQKDAVRVTTTAEKQQHSDIEYRALNVAQQDAENAIINVLRYYEAPNALVFCNTRAMVARLTTRFSNRGFSVVALSGELSQNERTHALQAMRDGRARVCVATDVAARGIDLPNLELVIHADLPSNSETLLHRSGRTGRAGRKGVSALIVPTKLRKKAERLLQGAKVRPTWASPPTADEVRERDEARLLDDPLWDEDVTEDEAAFAARLLDMHAPEKIAAAYLRLFAARASAPEDLSDPGTPPPPRAPFGPSVWFSLSVGRTQNAEPRWLLPMLCKSGGISRDDIGAIRIQPNETFVEMLASSEAGFLKNIGPNMMLEGGTAVKRLATAPDLARGPRPPRDDAPRLPRSDVPRPARHDKPQRDTAPRPPKSGWQPDTPDAPAPRPKEKYRAPEAPAATPKPKPAAKAARPWEKAKRSDEPGKAARPWEKPKRDGAPAKGKPPFKGKPRADGPAAKSDASDPSKRFTPPGGKPGGKPFKPRGPKGKPVARGPNAAPRRKP